MLDYNMQITIFSFLDVQDINNIIMTSRNAYQSKDIIVRDIWCERYPELYGKVDHTITNMFYVDMVWQFMDTLSIDDMMFKLNLHDLDNTTNSLEGYDDLKIKVDKFSLIQGRLQRTYDRLHDILMMHLREYEGEEDYGEEDFEMFTYALMEYGHSIYSKIMHSKNPYLDGTIDDDMVNARSNAVWFEEQRYGDKIVADINMEELGQELVYNTIEPKILDELEAMEDDFSDIDDYEYECREYGVIPYSTYERQESEIDRMEDLIESEPINTIKMILCMTGKHPELLDDIKDGILNYMDRLMPNTIQEINDMLE